MAYAFHRTRPTSSATLAALRLLQKLKTRFTIARGSGNCLFISISMITPGILYDDTHLRKSWCAVGQGMLVPRDISRIGRETFPCGIADEPWTRRMRVFETMTRKGFEGPDLHLAHYTLPPLNLGNFCTRNRVQAISQQRSVIQTWRAPVSTIDRPQYPSRRASAGSYPTLQFPILSTPFDRSLTWLPNGKGGSAKSVSSAGPNTTQIPGNGAPNIPARTRKSPLPVPAHQKPQVATDTKGSANEPPPPILCMLYVRSIDPAVSGLKSDLNPN